MKKNSSLLKFLKSKWGIAVIVLVILCVGGYYLFFKKGSTYKFISVSRGSITETVSITGNTAPEQSVALSFGGSGIISRVYSSLGKKVRAGEVLAELNMNELLAGLHNAEAALIIARQNASASKNNVANVTAEQNSIVESAHRTLLSDGLVAVAELSTNTLTAPTISGAYNGLEGTYKIIVYKGSPDTIGENKYGILLQNLEYGKRIEILDNEPTPLGTKGLFISFPIAASNYKDTTWYVTIPNTKSESYLANYNVYQKALKARDKAIADAEANTAIGNSQSVADAEIAKAQANVESAKAQIENARIVAPISGTITQFDAKVGQLASPGVSLVSIMSDVGYEVDAGASETDVGKISIGDKVSMTLDAFSNETFTGTVFYIAPSQTNAAGVITYQTKISFDNLDPRIKSGFTANITIETNQKDNILVLPQYAILQNDKGTFVEVLENNKVKQKPVILGIQDQKGNVEVISGVSEGEQVLNIGLRVQ